MKQAIVLGDIHAPFHDVAAMDLVIALIHHYRFAEVISVGDMSDQLAAGRFSRSRQGKYDLQAEIDSTVELAQRLQSASPDSKFVVTLGNHDVRIDRKLDELRNNLDLGEVHSLSLSRRLRELGWVVVPYRDSYELTPHLHVTHDFGKSGKASLLAAHAKYGTAVVYGHTHKAGIWYEGSIAGPVHGYMNVGWLGDAKAIDYAHSRTVSQESITGVGIVTLGPDGLYHLSFSPFIRGEGKIAACVNGEWWSVPC